MFYSIEKNLVKTDRPQHPFVGIISYEEYADKDVLGGFEKKHIVKPENLRFCKVEVHQEKLYASFCIPKKKSGSKKISFSYCISKDAVLFIDDSGYVKKTVEEMSDTFSWKQPSIGRFLFNFMEVVIQDDLEQLEVIEDLLMKMESDVLDNNFDKFNQKMMPTRKAILAFAHYYSQLADTVNGFVEDETGIFSKQEQKMFEIFYSRAIRLRNETQMLREYSGQISEIYQAQIDIYQNKVMKILTVVTTIFLPLSLLAGWYGMNFKNMPELEWPYSYPIAAAAGVIIIAVSLYILKKKKFW